MLRLKFTVNFNYLSIAIDIMFIALTAPWTALDI